MRKLNTKGFGFVEVLLIIVLVGLLASIGYFVYSSQKKTNTSLDNAAKSQGEPQKSQKTTASKNAEVKDETASWKLYTSEKGGFSFKYPTTWVTATHPELCSDGLVLLAPNEAALGKCASESAGQVFVAVLDGDQSKSYQLSGDYVGVTKSDVVSPIGNGLKYTGTAKGQTDAQALGGLPDGTKVINYVFVKNGKTYVVSYNQRSTYQDVSGDIELLVTKTLKLN